MKILAGGDWRHCVEAILLNTTGLVPRYSLSHSLRECYYFSYEFNHFTLRKKWRIIGKEKWEVMTCKLRNYFWGS